MSTDKDWEYRFVQPQESLKDFVKGYWLLINHSGSDKEVIILPDGRIDLFFSKSDLEPFHITLSGLETQADQATLAAGSVLFAVSFKLLATEYILHNTVSNILDNARLLPDTYWDFHAGDLNAFDAFCEKAERKILSLLPDTIDSRKQKLFELLDASNGALGIAELSEQVAWSSRQINRYFKQQFGLSLKAYCNILRFRASFDHIKEGKLFPQQNFADQSHFIKEVKKLSGVSPKELKRNKNDRFIQFSTLQSE